MNKYFILIGLTILLLGLSGCVEETYIIDDGGATEYSKLMPGCFAYKFVADVDLNAGTIVQASVNGNFRVEPAIQANAMPLGVVYESAVADANVWVCTSGVVLTTFKSDVVPSQGWIAYVSTEDGRADNSAAIPGIPQHNAEIGHVLTYGSTGESAYINLHFN